MWVKPNLVQLNPAEPIPLKLQFTGMDLFLYLSPNPRWRINLFHHPNNTPALQIPRWLRSFELSTLTLDFPPVRPMAQPIILSDEDQTPLTTPVQSLSKKPRTGPPDAKTHTILVLDDPTPEKPGPTSSLSSTPSFVAETPMSDLVIVKCSMASSLDHQSRVSTSFDRNFPG